MSEPISRWRRIRRWTKRTLILFGVLFGSWCLVLAIGMIPVNNDYTPAEDGIEVFVISNAVHADLVLPLSNDVCDWQQQFPESTFTGEVGVPSHVAIGWGDQGFFINTPTWNELKFSTAANALLWSSPTCVHVQLVYLDGFETPQEMKSIRISPSQYKELVAFIQDSFQLKADGNRIQISGAAYGPTDAFFEAKGSYHLLNTCNSWVGRALRAAKVRTGLMTPMPGTPTWYFPEQ